MSQIHISQIPRHHVLQYINTYTCDQALSAVLQYMLNKNTYGAKNQGQSETAVIWL